MKDPIAIFSAEWLASTFNMDVIVLIRHPAAFVSSLKRLNWTFPFSHFLEQPLLMRDYLYPFKEEIKKYAIEEHDIIDQATLLWKIIHYVIAKFKTNHKDWIFVRHEDISKDPLVEFQNIFEKLNLQFSNYVKNIIKKYTNSTNPVDPSNPSSLRRNSKQNIWNWKNRLNKEEIVRIRYKVKDISDLFYSDEEW